MRDEKQMMQLIFDVAGSEQSIRAAILSGSRDNPNEPRDIFQDYDVYYIVTDIEPFLPQTSWIDVFGQRAMMQMPEMMRDPLGDGRFSYLILLADGNRLDIQLIPIEKADQLVLFEPYNTLLLDKDGMFDGKPLYSDPGHYFAPLDELNYASCCNNFWWCMQNVAKGLWRKQIAYAMHMFHNTVRAELHDMLGWSIELGSDFARNGGKFGKHFARQLPSQRYEAYLATYSDANVENMWQAVFAMCHLFSQVSREVAVRMGFAYSESDEQRMMRYLHMVHDLPDHATSFETF